MTKKKDIGLLRVAYLPGPNIWTYRPVIEAWVDIGLLEDFPSNKLPGFNERLVAWLPTLAEHRCGVGVPGGFLERLRDGTWAAHILEHVVLELQNLAGMRTGFGKARQTSEPGIYKVAFRTREERVGRAALTSARELIMAAIEGRPFDVAAAVEKLRALVDALCLGPSTAHIIDAAIERRIPFIRLNDGNLVQLGHGAAQRRIWTAETDQTSAIAEGIASDKELTKSLLASCGVPIPEGRAVDSAADAWEAASDIGLPVVVKPSDGNHGRGVSTNLTSQAEVESAYELAEREGSEVLVERFVRGDEHRLLVIGNKLVAAARGESATVTGDGSSSIAELINSQINSDPRRGAGEEFPLNLLLIDQADDPGVVLLELSRQGYTPASVPPAGKQVLVQRHGNVAFDVTDQVHPSVAAAACLAARVVGLDIAGVDLVAEDISRPLDAQRGAIVEVNAGPGLLAHLKPATGGARPVGAAIVEHLFGSEHNGRIPVVGITGDRNTSLIARLVAWVIQVSGQYVGLACSEGLWLAGRQVTRNDSVNWAAGQRVLINRSVQAAVFEHSSRSILSEGLAYDRCAVGVVTNVETDEDLSAFHIREPEQHYNVVRTQVDVVLSSGVAVLNAADPQAVQMAELCDGSVMLYGLDESMPAIVRHRAEGGRAVFLREQSIVLAEGARDTALLELSALKPAKAAQPESVAAAVATCWALGIGPALIVAGLRTFERHPKH